MYRTMQQEKQRGADRQKDGFTEEEQQDTRATAALHTRGRNEVSCIQTLSGTEYRCRYYMCMHGEIHTFL